MTTTLRPIQIGQINGNGRVYPIRYPDTPQMEAVMRGIFEGSEYPHLDFLKQEPGVIVDIGANIGCTAIMFRLQYPDAPIFAFEPSPDTFEFLEENTRVLENARAFRYGLFDRDASTRLYTGVDVSVTSSIGESVYNGDAYETIALRRASSVLDELDIDRISLLKIDTEGAEVPILRDLEDRFDRIAAVFAEYHSERDRLEIDRLLSQRFTLWSSHATRPHLGTLTYVAHEIVETRTEAPRFEIKRPRL